MKDTELLENAVAKVAQISAQIIDNNRHIAMLKKLAEDEKNRPCTVNITQK